MSDNPDNKGFPNILIVDDDKSAADVIYRKFSEILRIPEEQIFKAYSKEEALKVFEDLEEMRKKIHLLIADIRLQREGEGLALLKKVREMEKRPFTIAISEHGQIEGLDRISDGFLAKPIDVIDEDKLKKILADCEAYRDSLESATAENIESIASASGQTRPPDPFTDPAPSIESVTKTATRLPTIPPPPKNKDDASEILSPFPPLKKFNTHNPLKIKDESLPLALFDLDGTLTRGSTRDVIMLHGFVRHLYKTHDENLWKPLMDRFDDWLQVELGMPMEKFYEKWDPRKKKEDIDPYEFYEEQIEKTSRIFGLNLKEIPVKRIKEEAEEYIKKMLAAEKSPFHDYAKTIIRDTDDRGIYSTIISGSPDFLVEIIARNIGASFYFGMEFDMEKRKNGKNEGEMEEFFAGGVRYITGKKEAKKRVTDKLSEEGHIILFGMGNRDADEPLAKASMSSMLVNLDKRDDRHFRRYCYTETRNNKITICDVATQAVIDTYRDRISGVMKKKGNIVKFRDLLLKMKPDIEVEKRNFTLGEVLEMLNKFYGYTAVYDALKLDLQKTHPDYLTSALQEIGVPEEIIAEVDEAIRFYQETGKPWEEKDDDEAE